MSFINKFGKTTVASSILAASVLGTTHVSFASGSGEGNQGQQGQDGDYMAIGNTKNPKNVIFMVGDGMGKSHTSAYRHFADNPDTKEVEKTSFDKYLTGAHQTHNDDEKENITDSAAAGTALSTGHKTYNGAIGVDTNKNKLKTVLEQAKENGKATGLVSTAEITDATPAVYASHVDDRGKKDEIAQQFYNDKINGQHKVDVLLGGGSKYFGKDNGNLTDKFQKDGYDYVTNKDELVNSQSDQVLGLFSEKDMPLQIDSSADEPKLADMQDAALDKLEKNQNGFFLMVEGASIDKAAHPNDITGVMSEMSSFDQSFQKAMEYAETHKDTLVVATADHATGGLSMGSGDEYIWKPEAIRNMKHSGSYMTKQIADGKDPEKVINEGYGIEFPSKQMDKVKDATKALKDAQDKAKSDDDENVAKATTKLQDAIQKPIDEASHTGWTTYGHTGEDVDIYAQGPGSDKFRGNIDNTDNAKNIFDFFSNDVTSNQNQQ